MREVLDVLESLADLFAVVVAIGIAVATVRIARELTRLGIMVCLGAAAGWLALASS